MALNSSLQQINLRERRLQFIRTHLEAFDVEPTFILSLFEEAVLGIDGTCGIEPMCHVDGNQLFAVDFQISNVEHTWPRTLTNALKFLDKVDSQVGVRLNRDLLERFVAVHIGSHKISNNTIGIDLRPRSEDSCIKVYLHLELEEEPEELVKTAIELDGNIYSSDLLQVLLKSTITIGFNMFLNGYSNIELWVGCVGEQYENHQLNRGKYLKHYINQHFSQKINSLLKEVTIAIISFPTTKKSERMLIFNYENIKNIRNLRKNFSFNSLGDKVYNFFQGQDCVTYAGVMVTESELEKDKLEKFSLLYNQYDDCKPLFFIANNE